MSIKVRYFASLAEQLGRAETSLEFAGELTVREVWARDNPDRAIPSNVLAAVNMDYAELSALVKDNDEVAFFPPVTGG